MAKADAWVVSIFDIGAEEDKKLAYTLGGSKIWIEATSQYRERRLR